MAYLRDLPDEIHIYTNQPAAVYLYVDRGAYVLPARTDSATGLDRPDFNQSVEAMRDEVKAGEAVIAIFDEFGDDSDDFIFMTDNFFMIFKGQNDTIFSGQP